ncbi:hypothetical protein GmHk_18G050784 [Glycine max]|nr:hypothetical protein GmHk_18G050784 [Glycine max]
MPQHTEFIDVADSDFLSNKELDDEDSEFETEFEKYFVYSTAKNRFFGQKRSLRRMDCTLISFIYDSLILLLATLFLWSHLTSFIDISPPPELSAFILPKGLLVSTAISVIRILTQHLGILLCLLTHLVTVSCGLSDKKVTVTLGAVSVLHYWLTAATLIYMSATYSQITKHLQFSIA